MEVVVVVVAGGVNVELTLAVVRLDVDNAMVAGRLDVVFRDHAVRECGVVADCVGSGETTILVVNVSVEEISSP